MAMSKPALRDAQFRVQRADQIFPREVVEDQRNRRSKRKKVRGRRWDRKIQNARGGHSQRCQQQWQQRTMKSKRKMKTLGIRRKENFPQAPKIRHHRHRKHDHPFDRHGNVIDVAQKCETGGYHQQKNRRHADSRQVRAKKWMLVHKPSLPINRYQPQGAQIFHASSTGTFCLGVRRGGLRSFFHYSWYSSAGISAGNKISNAPANASKAQSNHGTRTCGRSSLRNMSGQRSRRSSACPIAGIAPRNFSRSPPNSSLPASFFLKSSWLTAALLVSPVFCGADAFRETSAISPRPAKFPKNSQFPCMAHPRSVLAAPQFATAPAIPQTLAKSSIVLPAARPCPFFPRPPPPRAIPASAASFANGLAPRWSRSAAPKRRNFHPHGTAHVRDALARTFPPSNPPPQPDPARSAKSSGTLHLGIAETALQRRRARPPRIAPAIPCPASTYPYYPPTAKVTFISCPHKAKRPEALSLPGVRYGEP